MFNRKAHWQSVYREKSPSDVSWYQTESRLSLELIHRTGVSGDEPMLDVGGGASVLVDFLYDDGFTDLSVLDISGKALVEAKSRLGDKSTNITWIECDITEFNPRRKYALWHDRAVFHFLTDASDRRKYVSALTRALVPGGHLIIAAFAIGGPDKCSGLEIVQYDASKMKAELGGEFNLLEERGEVHVTPAGREQEFLYCRFGRKPLSREG